MKKQPTFINILNFTEWKWERNKAMAALVKGLKK